MSDIDKNSVVISQSYDELNPEVQEFLNKTCQKLSDIDKMDSIFSYLREHKSLFQKHGYSIILSNGTETETII